MSVALSQVIEFRRSQTAATAAVSLRKEFFSNVPLVHRAAFEERARSIAAVDARNGDHGDSIGHVDF